MRSNAVAWNPQEPMNFVLANEDTNLYTFDLRSLRQVRQELQPTRIQGGQLVSVASQGPSLPSFQYGPSFPICTTR